MHVNLSARPQLRTTFPTLLAIVVFLLLGGCTSLATQTNPVNSEFSRLDAVGLDRLYERAHNSSAEAQYELGRRLDTGDGIKMDPVQAVAWLRKAALQQHTDAQFCLGLMYADGRGVDADQSIAADWLQEAALQGHAMAMYRLGSVYTKGIGIARNPALGRYWLGRAADQDLAVAQHAVGLQILQDNGVAADRDKAAEWIYQAGVSYLDAGRPKSASAALLDMEQEIPGHALVTELRARLVLDTGPSITRKYEWNGNSVGTGWPLRPGYVVTNHHVIADSERITLINTSGEQFGARLVYSDRKRDIALLAVEDTSQLPPALPLAREMAQTGDSVFTLGFPRVDLFGDTPKLTAGEVLAERGRRGNRGSYELNLHIYQGNSGGPLINMNGEVVGIMTSLLGRVAENGAIHPIPDLSFAVKTTHLKNMLSSLPVLDPKHTELPHCEDNLDGLAQRIQQSMLIVAAH